MSFRNIIFDFDGTLSDSKHDIAGAQLWAMRQLGVDKYSKEDFFPFIGKPLEDSFARMLPERLHDRIPEAAELYAGYYRPRSLQTTMLFPGVEEVLQVLVEHGKRLAIASTKRGSGILRATDHFGITGLFAQLQGSDGMPFKPDPFILNKIITEQGWHKAETLMVGDTDNDILAGKNAGIATCGVTYGALTRVQLQQLDPEYIVDAFTDVLQIAGVPTNHLYTIS